MIKNNACNKYSIIPYVGSKSDFHHVFDRLMPCSVRNKRIYDLFGGSGAFSIYCCKRFGSRNVVFNDDNSVIVNLIQKIRDEPKKILQEYENHANKSNRKYYEEQKIKNLQKGIVGAGRFLYIAKNAYSGKIRFNSNGKFNVPMRINLKKPRLINEENFLNVSKTIKHLKIMNKSFECFKNLKNRFIYLDPPYFKTPHQHYGLKINYSDFIKFTEKIHNSNMLMISEKEKIKHTSKKYHARSIILLRSLHYKTSKISNEVIMTNYKF